MNFYAREVARITKRHLPKQTTTAAVIRARQMMDAHCCEAIDLGEMAAEAFLSRFHFIRLFKRCYGRTPHQYLTERRIKEAKQLLGAGATVEAACFGTGFSSVTSFSTLFRRHTGVSPSVWRKKSKNR